MSVHFGRFTDRKVIVTGSAQGIGLEVTRRLVAESADVVMVDRADIVHDVAAEVKAHAVVADLETFAGAEAAVTGACEHLGRIDCLINNVGGTIWAKPYQHYAPDEVETEIRRSLFPALWTCRAALPYLIAQRSGTIVNVSSVATRGINRIPYSAAKGGVNALTASLAMETAQYGIRVVAVAPGGTDAPDRRIVRGPAPIGKEEQAWYRQIVDQTCESSLMKRYGTLAEQAAAIVFLASDEASYITGTVLPVAGGDLG